MYYVYSWETQATIIKDGKPMQFEKLAVAKRWARGQGHGALESPGDTRFPPLAYVANDAGQCVYNPVFSARLGAGVSGLVNSQESDSF